MVTTVDAPIRESKSDANKPLPLAFLLARPITTSYTVPRDAEFDSTRQILVSGESGEPIHGIEEDDDDPRVMRPVMKGDPTPLTTNYWTNMDGTQVLDSYTDFD